MTPKPSWRQRLGAHYRTSGKQAFSQFRLGASFFFCGLVLVYLSKQMAASINQELLLGTGLIIVAIGFLIAMLAHIRLLIIRIIRFFSD
jgi:hypothetical protein